MLRQNARRGKRAAAGALRTGLTGNRNMLFGLHAFGDGAFHAY